MFETGPVFLCGDYGMFGCSVVKLSCSDSFRLNQSFKGGRGGGEGSVPRQEEQPLVPYSDANFRQVNVSDASLASLNSPAEFNHWSSDTSATRPLVGNGG